MEVEIKIEGLNQLEKNLLELGANLGAKTLRSALMDASKPMLESMKSDVPVNKGFLKKTLGRKSFLDKRGKRAPVLVQVGAVRKGAWKAHFQEFGTSKTSAKPFIRPAAEKTDEVLALFKVRLARRIELARKKLAKNK